MVYIETMSTVCYQKLGKDKQRNRMDEYKYNTLTQNSSQSQVNRTK